MFIFRLVRQGDLLRFEQDSQSEKDFGTQGFEGATLQPDIRVQDRSTGNGGGLLQL